MIRNLYLPLLFIVSILVSGCIIQPVDGTSTGTSTQSIGANGSGGISDDTSGTSRIAPYKLKPSDPIFIRFSGVLEQPPMEVVIDEKGEINLLHIESPVMAAGLTTSELEDKIERMYIDGNIYKTVSVNVTMTAMAYFVRGEVNAPGKFQLSGSTTLVQAITEARGLTPFAGKKVTITRQGRIYKFNWKKLEKDPSLDVKIEAGDVIKVWQSWY